MVTSRHSKLAFRIISLLLLVLTLVSMVNIIACSSPTTPTTPTSPTSPTSPTTPTTTSTPQTGKVYTLKFNNGWGPDYFATLDLVNPEIKAIETQSNGRIKFDMYYSSSLVPANQGEAGLASGIADISGISFQYKAGGYPREAIQELPYSTPEDPTYSKADADIMMALYQKFYYKEIDPGIHVLSVGSTSFYRVMTTSKRISRLEDLKGLKLRSGGGQHSEIIKALGATPIQMINSDVPDALARGIIDGVFWTYAASAGWGGQKYLKYSTDLTMALFPSAHGINKKTWDSLPPDLQKIVGDVFAGYGIGEIQSYLKEERRQFSSGDMKLEEVILTPEEKARWKAVTKPVWSNWMTTLKDKTGEDPKEYVNYLAGLWKTAGYVPPTDWSSLGQ